ncbi:hypothetical protein APY04_1433 [Hyphomicrobium sulfonivorans]|uniref:Uncharacterized protein n=1 Tax=Hyphomicrobium sulfonivorans TaxID=121290 RepID=A0A109BIY0_HYPSL|nr:hypothetical protein APY04_1433 [Hyphomicrobium sulfonivorans]
MFRCGGDNIALNIARVLQMLLIFSNSWARHARNPALPAMQRIHALATHWG